jgi:dTDP-4-amino-4,6-dideoxygalactose transaminase
MIIPFNKPYMTGKELYYIAEAKFGNMLAGDGPFTKRCHQWLEQRSGCSKALLTHSCTGALEMAALLLDMKTGDEVIMPSYTFTSTANAFVLRGATPVFVDIREDTLNLDERLVEDAITPRTRAIVPVHYAGVACEMDTLLDVALRNNLVVLEDAAQGVMATYKGRALGSIGHLGAYSFHETKNLISGEGGALLVNDPIYGDMAEIIREKGTDRSRFFRGEVDKYTWQHVGSSYLPGELTAAFLWAQLEEAHHLTDRKLSVWDTYHARLAPLEAKGLLRRPIVPPECGHNAHLYYILLPNETIRNKTMQRMKEADIRAIFHYIPLHSSPAGQRYGRTSGELPVTDSIASRILRLPMWIGLGEHEVDQVVDTLEQALHT